MTVHAAAFVKKNSRSGEYRSPESAQPGLKNPDNCVLIFDGDPDLVEMMCAALEMEKITAFGTSDPNVELTALIREGRPGVLLLDYVHTGEFCIRLCREVKAVFFDLPVIAVSCNSRIAELYGQHGFDDHLEKPFDLQDLYTKVRQHLPAG